MNGGQNLFAWRNYNVFLLNFNFFIEIKKNSLKNEKCQNTQKKTGKGKIKVPKHSKKDKKRQEKTRKDKKRYDLIFQLLHDIIEMIQNDNKILPKWQCKPEIHDKYIFFEKIER